MLSEVAWMVGPPSDKQNCFCNKETSERAIMNEKRPFSRALPLGSIRLNSFRAESFQLKAHSRIRPQSRLNLVPKGFFVACIG
jgi:hypothetical protein